MPTISRRHLRALDTAAVLTSVSPVLIFVVGRAWPHVLDGTAVLDAPSLHANFVRNTLELTSFAATTALAITALLAVLFTMDQIEHAEKSRLAEVYIKIVDRFNSEEQVNSRKLFHELRTAFDQIHPNLEGQELAERRALYVSEAIANIGRTDPMKERDYLVSLYFFEDLGILCRKQYIKPDDIFDLFGDHIISIFCDLRPFVKNAREEADAEIKEAVYANAVRNVSTTLIQPAW